MFHPIILASASPRRREILEQVGIPCIVMPSTKEEIMTKKPPEELVKNLAYLKASDVKEKSNHDDVILGADTVVVHHNHILGKPKDREDAISMLRHLEGETHQVFTGVAILYKENVINFAVETKVTVMPMTWNEIIEYVDADQPMDKAGSYGIQGRFAAYIKEITGDYYNVVGLPISAVFESLKQLCIEGIS